MKIPKWSVDLEQFVEPNHFVRLKYEGKVVLYLNYALGVDRLSVARDLVKVFNKKGVAISLPEFDDDSDLKNEPFNTEIDTEILVGPVHYKEKEQ